MSCKTCGINNPLPPAPARNRHGEVVAAEAARKAGIMSEGSGTGKTYFDPIEVPTAHPAFPAGRPDTSWDRAISKAKMIDFDKKKK